MTMRRTTPIIVHDVHAREPRKGRRRMGTQNIRVTEAFSFRKNRAFREQKRLQVIRRAQIGIGATETLNNNESEDKFTPMALSEAAKTWFNLHGLEGFLRIEEAPSHGCAENGCAEN